MLYYNILLFSFCQPLNIKILKFYYISIIDIYGDYIDFIVDVRPQKHISEIVFNVEGPLPGYENTTNIITISSPEYNMLRISKIVFLFSYNGETETEYIVDKNMIEQNICSTKYVSFPLYLPHNSYYKLKSIVNEDDEENSNFDYVLSGFYLKTVFFFLSSNLNYIEYELEFYNSIAADATVQNIYENNIHKKNCLLSSSNTSIVYCTYDISDKTQPTTLNISLKENETNADRIVQVHLLTYEVDQTCFDNEMEYQTTSLRIASDTELGSVRRIFNDKIYNARSICFQNSSCIYEVEITISTDGLSSSDIIEIDIFKYGSYIRHVISDIHFKIINYATFEGLENQIFFLNISNSISLIFNNEVVETDISYVKLTDVKSNNNKYMLINCDYIWNGENTLQTCNFEKGLFKQEGMFLVEPYNQCGTVIKSKDPIYMFVSYERGILIDVTPRALPVDKLDSENVIFTYLTKEDVIPKTIELVSYLNNNEVTPYTVSYSTILPGKETNLMEVRSTIKNSQMLGLFQIKTTFEPNIIIGSDISNLTLLIYENEILLSKENEEITYALAINNITISLQKPIFPEQIAKVRYKIKGTTNETVIPWKLISETELQVNFTKNILIKDTYQIIIIQQKDYSIGGVYEIIPQKQVDFAFSRQIVDLGKKESSQIIAVPTNDIENQVYKISSDNDKITFYKQQKQSFISEFEDDESSNVELDISFVGTYHKSLARSGYPETYELKYYFTDVAEPFIISTRLVITDYTQSLFDLSSIPKEVYLNEKLEIILQSSKLFKDIELNYKKIGAILKNNTDKIELLQDETFSKKFYLPLSKTKELSKLTLELNVYENNDYSSIINQGFKIYFAPIENPLPIPHCLNGGKYKNNKCNCPEGFYGSKCEFNNDNVDGFIEEFERSFADLPNKTSDENYVDNLLDYVSIAKEGRVTIPNLDDQINNFTNTTPSTETETEGYFLWASLILGGDKTNVSQDVIEQNKQAILNRTKEVAKNEQMSEGVNYTKNELPLQYIEYFKIKDTDTALNNYTSDISKSENSYVEIGDEQENSNDGFYILTTNDNNTALTNNTGDVYSMDLQYYPNKSTSDNDIDSTINQNGDVVFHFSLYDYMNYKGTNNNTTVDIELFTEYAEKGINIYSSLDPAFSDTCFTTNTEYFDFDLTQAYRKQHLYQNKSFSLTEDTKCSYNKLSSSTVYISYVCNYPYKKEQMKIALQLQKLPLNENDYKTVKFLPMKCLGKINQLNKNIALWLFIVFMLLTIVGYVLILRFDQKITKNQINTESHDQTKEYDVTIDLQLPKVPETKNSWPKTENQVSIKELNNTNTKQSQDDGPKVQIKSFVPGSFWGTLKKNFFRLYPVTSLFPRYSKVVYIKFKVIGLVLSIFSLMGFNAIYFTETYIEKRIYNNSRNSFGYPLVNETSIIFSSVFTTVLITILTKLIILNIHVKEVDSKNNKIRGCIYCFVCVCLIIIFGVYCIGFCGVYKITQYGWFYSFIWSFLFNWIILAPVSIVVVTVIERSQCCGRLREKIGKDKSQKSDRQEIIFDYLFWV